MSRDLKDIIDTVEQEAKSRSELEATISSLKEEINRLKFTIKEQHLLIEEQGDQITFAQSDLPSEINILKEMITSQRKDLIKRDEKIDRLNDKIDELTSQMENPKEAIIETQNDEISKAQELILKLSEENEQYRHEIEDLIDQIKSIKSEKVDLEETNKAQMEENQELVNIKRLNFQLMEQNGLLRVEVESLKTQLQERITEGVSEELDSANEKIEELTSEIDSLKSQLQERIEKVSSEELDSSYKKIEDLTSEVDSLKSQLHERIEIVSSEELELAYSKIEVLKSEIEDYDAQLKFLQRELEKNVEPTIISAEEALEFAEMRDKYEQTKSELLKNQKENELLNNKLSELEAHEIELFDGESSTNSIAYDFPEHYQISLFKRMYKLLNDNNKKAVINSLINDLNSKKSEIKRSAIKILSEIKDKDVYNAFLELIHDEDWLIRYNLIKALSKFDFGSEEFKKLLKKLLNDTDVDVRELAAKMLNEISR